MCSCSCTNRESSPFDENLYRAISVAGGRGWLTVVKLFLFFYFWTNLATKLSGSSNHPVHDQYGVLKKFPILACVIALYHVDSEFGRVFFFSFLDKRPCEIFAHDRLRHDLAFCQLAWLGSCNTKKM